MKWLSIIGNIEEARNEILSNMKKVVIANDESNGLFSGNTNVAN